MSRESSFHTPHLTRNDQSYLKSELLNHGQSLNRFIAGQLNATHVGPLVLCWFISSWFIELAKPIHRGASCRNLHKGYGIRSMPTTRWRRFSTSELTSSAWRNTPLQISDRNTRRLPPLHRTHYDHPSRLLVTDPRKIPKSDVQSQVSARPYPYRHRWSASQKHPPPIDTGSRSPG